MSLRNRRVLIFAAEYFEESELIYPIFRLKEDGAEVLVAGLSAAPVNGKNGMTGYPVDVSVEDLDTTSGFDALVIPGGFAPDFLRRSSTVLDIVQKMHSADKTIASVCHGGWVLISAGLLRGRRATSVPAIKDDMVNAGALYVDEPVVVDGNLITARVPADMGPWMKAVIARLERDPLPGEEAPVRRSANRV